MCGIRRDNHKNIKQIQKGKKDDNIFKFFFISINLIESIKKPERG
jgi:hypothetical protein